MDHRPETSAFAASTINQFWAETTALTTKIQTLTVKSPQ